jgi:hypothetical protein
MIIIGLSLFIVQVINSLSPAQAAGIWIKSTDELTLDDEPYVVDAWILWDETAGEYNMWYTHGKSTLDLSEVAAHLIAQNEGDIIDDIANLDLEQLLIDISGLNSADILDFLGDASTVIGYATSTDGLDWDIVKSQALVGSGGFAWNSVGNPCVIWDVTSNKYKIWYTNSKTDLDLASFQTILADLGDTDPGVVKAAIIRLPSGNLNI